MTFSTKREKHYIDFLPQISLSFWRHDYTLYIGWLFWNIVISK